MAEELSDTIKSNAQGPRSASGDTGSMQQHSLLEQIEVDRYLKSQAAANKGLGVRFVKLVPPGT
jgi:hypothetical protein